MHIYINGLLNLFSDARKIQNHGTYEILQINLNKLNGGMSKKTRSLDFFKLRVPYCRRPSGSKCRQMWVWGLLKSESSILIWASCCHWVRRERSQLENLLKTEVNFKLPSFGFENSNLEQNLYPRHPKVVYGETPRKYFTQVYDNRISATLSPYRLS